MNAKPYNFFLIIILTNFFVFSSLKSNDASSKDLAIHHFMQGEFLLNQGNYALAVLEFQDAISIDPNASTIHVSIADAYRRLGRAKHAEDHLKIAIDLDPKDCLLYTSPSPRDKRQSRMPSSA